MTQSSWGLLFVLVIATALRIWRIGAWSLWEDEETSLYFSQHLGAWFPQAFPLFFLSLEALFRVWGISVVVGRGLAAVFGVLSVWMAYELLRKLLSRQEAFLASLLLAMNVGCLFFSQSIRYYTCVMFFQLLSLYWFMEGFERRNYLALLLSNLAFILAMLSHFSTILLAPVYFTYLTVMMLRRENTAGYGVRGYVVFCLPLLAILGFFSQEVFAVGKQIGAGVNPATRDLVHTLVTVIAYFGAPVVLLAWLGPLLARHVLRRITIFLIIVSVLPILELIAVALLKTHNLAWYYILFSLVGITALTSTGLISLYQRSYWGTSSALTAGTLLYSLIVLVGYYTTAYGDRPRWQDAARYLQQSTSINVESDINPRIFATVPGVVAHYLGVAPGETMGHSLVQRVPAAPPENDSSVDQWYVLDARSHVPPQYTIWFAEQCVLKAQFAAWTGPIDRTVSVYHCQKQLTKTSSASH
jgi:uncharacterized membrane protein